MGLVHDGKRQHINHKPTVIRCFSVSAPPRIWHFEKVSVAVSYQQEWIHWKAHWHISNVNKQQTNDMVKSRQRGWRFWTETDKLKGKHVGNMLSGRWRRSSVSAAAYSSTLTTAPLLRSDQILTGFAASVHVTYDTSTDLSVDEEKMRKVWETLHRRKICSWVFSLFHSAYIRITVNMRNKSGGS